MVALVVGGERVRNVYVLLEVTVALAVGGRSAKEGDIDAEGIASIDRGSRAVVTFNWMLKMPGPAISRRTWSICRSATSALRASPSASRKLEASVVMGMARNLDERVHLDALFSDPDITFRLWQRRTPQRRSTTPCCRA